MATTEITVAAFTLALAECADAIEANNKPLALKKLAKAEAINAGLDLKVDAAGSGGPTGILVTRRESLEKTRKSIEAAFAGAAAANSSEPRVITGRVGRSR